MKKNLYEILGISKNASLNEIKKAYRDIANLYHTDKNPSNKLKAQQKFKEATMAYNILSNKDKRKQYDKYGSDTSNYSYSYENVNMDNIFKNFEDLFTNRTYTYTNVKKTRIKGE